MASGGSFIGGYTGTSVTWQAPESEVANITVYMLDDDLPNEVPPGDSGSRNDSTELQDTKTGIRSVIPEPNEVSAIDESGGNEHNIYNITDPIWTRSPGKNEPCSYTKGTKSKLQATFWDAYSLTKSETVNVDVDDPFGSYTADDGKTFGTSWPTGTTTHTTDVAWDNWIGANSFTCTWKYKVPSGSNNWITMSPSTHSHDIYLVYGAPTCAASNYTKSNVANAVGILSGNRTTEAEIASDANDMVGSNVYSGCICADGFQTNFDAAMGSYPTSGDKGMCCCRAEGLDCVLNVLGIGPYSHDYVNEHDEPNTSKDVYDDYCVTCSKFVYRRYWDGFWNNWEGVVKAGGAGSTCYAPANGSISIDEGTYSQIDAKIASDCGYYWQYGEAKTETCPHLGAP
jgi:hypothetical protein